MAEQLIGEVTHYYSRIGVAGIMLSGSLRVGDRIRVQGHTTDIEQTVDSMELDHASVEISVDGDDVAVKLSDRARVGDKVFLVTEETG